MIITNIIGGLGNQMFQYAAGLALSLKTNSKLLIANDMFENYLLHQGFELDRVFGITTPIASKEEIRNLIGWRSPIYTRRLLGKVRYLKYLCGPKFYAEYSEINKNNFFTHSGNVYLHGYWQSERFFLPYANAIRRVFTFQKDLNPENADILNKIKSAPSASIHIRRGDYLKGRNALIYHQCTLEYFIQAIQIMTNRFSDLNFFVFSDDPNWAIEMLSKKVKNAFFITNNLEKSSYDDMRLISSCSHHIISNSSFSWWGAWLNPSERKLVIAPSQWMYGASSKDFLPPNWVVI